MDLGLQSHGFLNLVTVTDPGSRSALSNAIVSIEHQVEWISDCIGHLRYNQIERMAPILKAEDAWIEHGNEVQGHRVHRADPQLLVSGQ